MTDNKEHDFGGEFGACAGCGRYVEECMAHRYCTPKPDPAFKFDTVADLLCNVGQFMDAVKPDLGDQWSEYDECLRKAVTRHQREAMRSTSTPTS